MSSTHAMEKFYGKKDKYRSSEGNIVHIPYKGAKCIKHMPKCTTFVLVSQQLNNMFK